MLRKFTSSRVVSSKNTSSILLLSSTVRFCAAPAGTAAMSSPESNAKIAEMAKLYSQLTLREISALQRQIFKELGHSDDFYEQALLRGLGGGGGGGGGAVAMNPQMMAAMAAASAAAPGAAAGGDAAKPAEEAKAEVKKAPPSAAKTSFDVSIASYPAENKIKLVKELRTVVPALSIKEAKDAIDKAPGIIAKALGKDDADKLKAVMESLGAKVELQ